MLSGYSNYSGVSRLAYSVRERECEKGRRERGREGEERE